MSNIAWVFTGGFAKGYRAQILGLVTALSAVASWAIGDTTLADLVTKAPVIFGGLGLAHWASKSTPPRRKPQAESEIMSAA